MDSFEKNILITGGAGFIGSHLVRHFVRKYPSYRIINLDALTYAGNLSNLRDIEECPNYVFVKGDICDGELVSGLFRTYRIDAVIHLAAESHVDRSVLDPFTFARTNVMGTLNLLHCARTCWGSLKEGFDGKLFYHISTDEVYGDLPITRDTAPYGESFFTEETAYRPHSPYSASKASSDHFVRAFHDTYGMPVTITYCSNNYGPFQHPEKLIPLFINNIVNRRPLPVYGRGENVRDWLYVEDHVRAIDLIFHARRSGATFNIGGFNERRNIDVIRTLISTVDRILGRAEGEDECLVTFVGDRPGHDLRYAIDSSLLTGELGWKCQVSFEQGIEKTVRWYLGHTRWLEEVTSGEYMKYYDTMYSGRK